MNTVIDATVDLRPEQLKFDVAATSIDDLVNIATQLGARSVRGWSAAEDQLASAARSVRPEVVETFRDAILAGSDPLGDAFCRILSPEMRRPQGATYTPSEIVQSMLAWSTAQLSPARVIDPGTGSARFLVAAGRECPRAELVGIELDPVAAILARGHLSAAGLAERASVILSDYRTAPLGCIEGRTLFLGNPPYVRHHLIEPHWKAWLVDAARRLGHDASQLAGLHVHFFLATATHARPGDVGVLITAAEWMDVNYGRLVRELLTGVLGAQNIQMIEPSADPFPGTQSTAVITGFEVGSQPRSIGLRRVATLAELGALDMNVHVSRERLESASRWTTLTRPDVGKRAGFVELGELCRVHRGQVTGANRIWIDERNEYFLPESVRFPSITRARELFAAHAGLDDASGLKRVIDLPVDLSVFETTERQRIDKFLENAMSQGAHEGFIARHRKAWWSVGLREPAPILASYMARRPPVFVRNLATARHINIAHGLYPRESLTDVQLRNLALFLSRSVSTDDGRTYAGGLTKFEPREMERLLVPTPDQLADTQALELIV